jgi:hypothetical protein
MAQLRRLLQSLPVQLHRPVRDVHVVRSAVMLHHQRESERILLLHGLRIISFVRPLRPSDGNLRQRLLLLRQFVLIANELRRT